MEKLAENIWKFKGVSNIYYLNLQKKMIIDAGFKNEKTRLEKELKEIVDPKEIEMVILTHLHYDHVGNIDLFPNAKFYASPEEIEAFKKDKVATILDPETAENFKVELHPLTELEGFDIITTPGHTHGSICLLYKKEKILFSGDTLFHNGMGRLDLPSSIPEKMDASLKRLDEVAYKLLAPGHDY
ncbi:MBL fold metallo-hydrolase [Candidatus Woesearchaeota archaeon]|nr:MBL fold metallo-hydrolase [Candidatus Woesearchaeota archaeon]